MVRGNADHPWPRPRIILLACLIGIALEVAAAFLLPLPPNVLFIPRLIARQTAHATAIGDTPKLVILAGSNGAFSHRCEAMEPVLAMPCANGSVAVGIGLDYLFARWAPLLHPGDVVYMPMEPQQYTRSRAANRIGPESRLFLHGEWPIARQLAWDRQLGALFSIDLATALSDLTTAAALHTGLIETNHDADYNDWGDRVGHTRASAPGAAGSLDDLPGAEPDAGAIAAGYGAALIGGFVRQMTARGVTVIGGLSTGFRDVGIPAGGIAAEQAVFTTDGGGFLVLPNLSRYPRHDFFDTRFHLDEACQIRHALIVARALAPLLHRPAMPVPAWDQRANCPGAEDGR